MNAVAEIRELRVGDAVMEDDEPYVVVTLELGERIARMRLLHDGDTVLRELRPWDMVLRTPRELLPGGVMSLHNAASA